MYPGFSSDLSNGGSRSWIKRAVAANQSRVHSIHRLRDALGSPAPESTDQLWAIESIWHSGFAADPSGVPSSKYARRYHSPSQPCCSMLLRIARPPDVHRSANGVSPRRRASLGELFQDVVEEEREPDAFALAVLADAFMPSFQSPDPISGRPCSPKLQAVENCARAVFVQASPISSDSRGRS